MRVKVKMAENEVKRFQALMDEAPVGIFNIDLKGKITYVNRRFEEVSGYSREEVVGKSGFKLGMVSDETIKLLVKRMKERLMGRPLRILEIQFKCKDGHWIWVSIEGKIIREQGIPVGFQIISRDITERKQAEEELQAEKNKLQSLIGAMEYGFTILDKNHNILYLKEPVGIPSGGHIGDKCYQVFEGRDKPCDVCPVEKAFKDGKSHTSERKTVTPSGEVIFWENTANPIRDAKGRVVSCLEINRNITERKRAEEALQVEKNKLQSIIGAMEDGLTILDTDYNIIYHNESIRRIWGECVGEKCYRAYEGQEKVCEGCPVEKAFRDGKSHISERRTVTPSGEVVFWENTANPIRDAEGRIASCLEIGRNITERKQMEEALRESEGFTSSLLESSPNPIEVINPDTSVRYVNPAFEKLAGFTLAEVAERKAPHPWWPEELREEIFASLKRTIACGGIRKERERVFQKKNGERFWVAINSAPVMHDGKLIYILLNWVDITERKRMEQALRESEEKFSKAFRSSPSDSITLTRLKDGVLLDVNDRFLNITGYTREEVINHTAIELGIWTKAEDRARMLQMLKEKGRVHNEEFTFGTKSGETRETLFSAELIDIGGEPCVISMTIDISELRKAERALEHQKAYFQQLFDNSPDAIAWVDTADKIVSVNKGFETLFGYRTEEIKGRFINDTIVPQDHMEEASVLSQARFSNKVVRKETVRKHKDGNLVDVSVLGYPIRFGNKTVGAYAIYTDITERKQAEEREKHLQQELYLAQRLASIGELAAGVAHEINNPLTGVLGFSQRLLRKSPSEEFSRDLEIIHGEAQRAANVVQNLLTFARRREPRKEYSNINDIVQKALELRGYALQTGNIEVMTDLAPSLPQIMVDFPQIQEVLLNIILNAEHAINEANVGGKLIIKTRQVKDYVRISFADDGPGVPAEQLDKVFDPFFTTRADRGGTGLGLSACHGIVTRHGGRIYVRSKPGKGATFFVELPLSLIETTVGRGA